MQLPKVSFWVPHDYNQVKTFRRALNVIDIEILLVITNPLWLDNLLRKKNIHTSNLIQSSTSCVFKISNCVFPKGYRKTLAIGPHSLWSACKNCWPEKLVCVTGNRRQLVVVRSICCCFSVHYFSFGAAWPGQAANGLPKQL